jgi:hypothetical protein
MNHEDIIKRLREPFSNKEIEWKIQVTSQDKTKGLAVAYMDARAVQKRLDEVVGPFNWKNEYSLWHDHAQICGISLYDAEKEQWVTKFDGAENSDIEPVKGGLSDSFKRAATVWGIGRYLYELDGQWVEIEPKGKSFSIKQSQYNKLESAYNATINRIFGFAPKQENASASPSNNQTPAPSMPSDVNISQPPKGPAFDYRVQLVKPSGKNSQFVELVNNKGEKVTAYIKATDTAVTTGSQLKNVVLSQRDSQYGKYNLIDEYELELAA